MPRHRRMLEVVLLAALTVAFPAAANSNKLVNPMFYPGLDGWTIVTDPSYQVLWVANQGYAEPGAMIVAATGDKPVNHVVAKQTVNVSPGSSYSVGTYFWYSPDSATVPTAEVGVTWFTGLDGAGSVIALDATLPTPTGPAGTWLLTYEVFVAPPNANSAVIHLGFTTLDSKTALALFDDPFVFGGLKGGVIGDVNGDGTIAVDDVFYLVNHLFSKGPLPVGPSDVNNDFKVDVSDVFYLINYLFGGGDPPVE